MPGANDTDPMLAVNIRRFYLFPDESYSLADLALVWRVPLDDVCAIFSDSLGGTRPDRANPALFRVSRADALGAATTFHVFRPVDVERALGDDFLRVRSHRWRTVPLVIYLPSYIAGALSTITFTPRPQSLAARAERLVCETVEAECVLRSS